MRVLIDINKNATEAEANEIVSKLVETTLDYGKGIITATCLDRSNNGQFHEESEDEFFNTSHNIMKVVHDILVEDIEEQDNEVKEISTLGIGLKLTGMNIPK